MPFIEWFIFSVPLMVIQLCYLSSVNLSRGLCNRLFNLFPWFICLSLGQGHAVLITLVLQVLISDTVSNPPCWSSLLSIVVPLYFNMNFRLILSNSTNNETGILVEIAFAYFCYGGWQWVFLLLHFLVINDAEKHYWFSFF